MSKPPLVELVSHCYAAEIPCFAHLLNCQLSSLFLCPPSHCRVRITVCQTPDDGLTYYVAKEFAAKYSESGLPVELVQRMYGKRELFRRAIGRNQAALQTKSDVVWFIDCDYLIGSGCLDALVATSLPSSRVAFPREVMIHSSHAVGDAEIARVVPGKVFEPDLSLFVPSHPKVAIGGIQIVPGDVARRGYLDGTKWVVPRKDEKPFPDFRDDKAYRNAVGGSEPIDLPGVYRMRHSKTSYQER